jgi:glycosyltransferase involved in cell wall biosynthesis
MIDASIIVVSHNHEKYIQDCLASIISQETSLKYEIVWYDDASTDNTIKKGVDIIKEVADKFIYLHASNNRFSKKLSPLLEIIEHCRGKYIFFIEGDDFWIEPDKINLQINALNDHPSINLCFTPAYEIEDLNYSPTKILSKYYNEPTIMPLSTVISGDGGLMPSASLCLRRTVFDNAPNWFYGYMPVTDYPMQVLGSKENGALYLPNITSAYRVSPLSWTKTHHQNSHNRLIFEVEFLNLLINLKSSIFNQKDAFHQISSIHLNTLIELAMNQKNISLLIEGVLAWEKIIES